jgi:transcriptional regulator with XRE-family HTH domain
MSASATVTEDIRTRRRQLGISQQTLAAAAECSISALRLFESGYAPSASPTRVRVEHVLDELEAADGQHSASGASDGAPAADAAPVRDGDQTASEPLQRERSVAPEDA